MKAWVVYRNQLFFTRDEFGIDLLHLYHHAENIYFGRHPLFTAISLMLPSQELPFKVYFGGYEAKVRLLTWMYEFEIKLSKTPYFVFWSQKDNCYIAQSTTDEYVSAHGETEEAAEREIESLLPEVERIKNESSCEVG